jgi:DNA-binding transcriptional ArsR family regulator
MTERLWSHRLTRKLGVDAANADTVPGRGLCGSVPTDDTSMTNDWDNISFVISSRYRIVALRRLAVGPATPSQIASDADVGIAHVSRALQGLRERSLVDLLVSDDRKKGRVYGLTETGREVWDTIEAENLA